MKNSLKQLCAILLGGISLLYALASQAQQPAFLSDGLVAYYPFNGNANDESGNGNDGINHGAILAPDRFGNLNNAFAFDGKSSWISVSGKDLNIGKNITLSGWFNCSGNNPANAGENGLLARWQDTSGPLVGYFARITYGGSLDVGVVNPYYSYGGAHIDYQKWTQFCFTYNNNEVSTFVDGKWIATQIIGSDRIISSASADATLLQIGKEAIHYFLGSIDEVRIYNRALSAGEIAALYQYESNPPPTIVTQPISKTPAEGTQVNLSVTATGIGSLTYQWQIDRQNIPGATSSTLFLSAVRPAANGKYRVIVGNPYGTTISTDATIAVVVTDSDGDGLSDYEELLLGTNPNKADSDGDGLSDFAEVRTYGINPLKTDTDGDGYSDGIEVARDGNPNNASVKPTGALVVFPAVDVEFYTLNGVKYQLEVSTDMTVWTAQGGVVVGNGASQNNLVRASKTTQFWRLKVVQ